MRKKNFNILCTLALGLILVVSSCKDEWDSHFYPSVEGKSGLNLNDYIKSQPDLSIFAKMLSVSGYDSILSKPLSFTVWIPTDSALRKAGFDTTKIALQDTVNIARIVENHIVRSIFPTSAIDTPITMYMENKKKVLFSRNGDVFNFGSTTLVKPNIGTSNGVLHKIDGYVPYLNNIWETIVETKGLDSIASYLKSLTKLKFDAAASTKLFTDSAGITTYDSIFTVHNNFLSDIAAIDNEDSLYTMLLPTNSAWVDIYGKAKDSYKFRPTEANALAKQDELTRMTIVQDLVFRGVIDDPASRSQMVSTNHSVFGSPGDVFQGTIKQKSSNGLCFIANTLNFKSTELWNKEVRIEAEYSSYWVNTTPEKQNCLLISKNSLGSKYDISNDGYLYVENSTTNNTSPECMTFLIPNTLSKKYNVYCVFVPSTVIDTLDKKPSKVNFYFEYGEPTGVVNKSDVTDSLYWVVNQNNELLKPTSANKLKLGTFTTNGSEVTKMLVVKNFELPYCNIFDANNYAPSKVSVRLKIHNAAKTSETRTFNRSMRIDCIIFEPVE